MKSVVGLLLCLTAICSARVVDKPEDPLVAAYNSLPESEKKYFLEYNLAMGVLHEEKEENQGQIVKTIRLSSSHGSGEFVIPDSLNITDSLVEKFEAMDIPDRSTLHLLTWIKDQFGLEEEEVKELLLKGKVCPSRSRTTCYDVGDLGPLCCPW